jgi:PHD/YefM family antitoxin component YafN of YafNO toxin-antitoxin module
MITIPAKEYEQMKETIEILADPATARRILESMDQVGKGKTISEKEFSRKFGL